ARQIVHTGDLMIEGVAAASVPFQSDRRRISSSIPAISARADFIAWWSLDSRRRIARRARTAAAFLRCSSGESLALRRSASAGFVLIFDLDGLSGRVRRLRRRSWSGAPDNSL